MVACLCSYALGFLVVFLNSLHFSEAVVACACDTLNCNTYSVGPGQTYANIASAPLTTLLPGDWLCVYPKANNDPYFEKFVINRPGSADAPIVISGVADPTTGELPIIDGSNAITPTQLNYWNEDRGLVKIGAASVPSGPAEHIVVQNLHLRNAHPSKTFSDDNGNAGVNYRGNAACIYLEQGSNIVLRGNEVELCGNGVFITPGVENVVIEGNYIHSNGNTGSIYEHNTYTEARNMTYHFNRFGPPCAGCGGSNLKSRDSGLVVAYNHITGGQRQLDIVDSSNYAGEEEYGVAQVYGNILIEPEGDGNRQITHFGGDSNTVANYRDTLYFHYNTIYSLRTDRTTYFRLSDASCTAYAYNNIFKTLPSAASADELKNENIGDLHLTNNLITDGYINSVETTCSTCATYETGTILESAVVGNIFASYDSTSSDYLRLADSLPYAASLEPLAVPVTEEYVMHQSSKSRSDVSDLGAYDFASATCGTDCVANSQICDPSSLNCVDCLLSSDCDDGNLCTINACLGSLTCKTDPVQYGTSCGSSNDPCRENICDGQGSCINVNKADGSPCAFDDMFCTIDECSSGVCGTNPNTNPCMETGQKCFEAESMCCDTLETCGETECCDSPCVQDTTTVCTGKGKNRVCTQEPSNPPTFTCGGGGGGGDCSSDCSSCSNKDNCRASGCSWNNPSKICS